jgi:N-methylhydantoinase A/oxoprolinase/acetone carboxylase beta subunit
MASVMQLAAAVTPAELRATLEALAARAAGADGWQRHWWLRARYAGQGHELDVAATPRDEPATIAARFAELHAARFGFTLDRPVEVVSARHAAVGEFRPAALERRGPADWDPRRQVDGGGPLDAVVRGRAAIALPDATLLVAAGWAARALPIGGWLVERDA